MWQLGNVMDRSDKKSNWKNLGGGLRLYIPAKTIYAVKAFRYLGIPPLSHCYGPISEREARRLLPATIEKWKEMHLNLGAAEKGSNGEKTIAEIIPLFLKYETPKKRKRTQENHRQIYADIGRFYGDLKFSDLTEEIYDDRLEETVKPEKARQAEERIAGGRGGRARKTFVYLAVHLNALARWAHRKKHTPQLVKIPLADEYGKPGRAIDHETARALFREMNEDGKDMYALGYQVCMRRNEALKLSWERFDLKTGKITLRPEDVKTGSRTKRGRELIVGDEVLQRFRARYERQAGLNSPWVFPSPRDPQKPQSSVKTAWTAAKRRAGIQGRLRWHDLRHSGLTYLLLVCGQDIVKVSEYVGTSARTLQRVYLHARPEHTREVGEAIRFA